METFDDVWRGCVNNGRSIEGDIVLVWSYEKHVGYARNFLEIRYGGHNELESDLVTTNHERVWSPVAQVLLEKRRLKPCQMKRYSKLSIANYTRPGNGNGITLKTSLPTKK